MSSNAETFVDYSHARVAKYLGGAIGIAALLAGIATNQSLAFAAVCLTIPVGLVLIRFPDLITALVIVVLYSNMAVVGVKFHNVPSRLAELVPVLLLIPLIYHIVLRRQKIIFTPALPLIAIFIVIQLLGVNGARYPNRAIDVVKTSVFEGIALYFLLTNIVRDRRTARQAVAALLVAGSVMGALSLFQQLSHTFHNDYGGFAQTAEGEGFHVAAGRGIEARQPRLCGPIGEQNRYAQIMLMLAPLALFQSWTKGAWTYRLLGIAACVLSSVGCVLAFSRGAAVGFVLMLVLMTVMGQLKVRQLALIGCGALVLLLLFPQYRTRLASLHKVVNVVNGSAWSSAELDGAIRGRATVMLAAARVTADYPVLGVGPGMFNYYASEYGNTGGLRELEGNREAHSLYLEIAAEHGFVGLTCFLLILTISLVNLTRTRRWWQQRDPALSNLASGYILAIAAYLTTGLFLHLSYARYFWMILALADATSQVGVAAQEESSTEPSEGRNASSDPRDLC